MVMVDAPSSGNAAPRVIRHAIRLIRTNASCGIWSIGSLEHRRLLTIWQLADIDTLRIGALGLSLGGMISFQWHGRATHQHHRGRTHAAQDIRIWSGLPFRAHASGCQPSCSWVAPIRTLRAQTQRVLDSIPPRTAAHLVRRGHGCRKTTRPSRCSGSSNTCVSTLQILGCRDLLRSVSGELAQPCRRGQGVSGACYCPGPIDRGELANQRCPK